MPPRHITSSRREPELEEIFCLTSDASSDGTDANATSPDEEVKPNTRKRATRTTTIVTKLLRRLLQTKKHKPTVPSSAFSDEIRLPALHEHIPSYTAIHLQEPENTPTSTKWFKALPDLKIKEVVLPNVIELNTIRPLCLLPDIPGRALKYKIELFDLKVNWDPAIGEHISFQGKSFTTQIAAIATYSNVIKTWRMFVWDSAIPNADAKP
jgi:hypothetical protein